MAAAEPKEIEKEVGEEPEVVVGTHEAYSIYTNKEKWLIVAMVALAGFYRYVQTGFDIRCELTVDVALCQPTYTSQLYLR